MITERQLYDRGAAIAYANFLCPQRVVSTRWRRAGLERRNPNGGYPATRTGESPAQSGQVQPLDSGENKFFERPVSDLKQPRANENSTLLQKSECLSGRLCMENLIPNFNKVVDVLKAAQHTTH
jgi:hypothetical protein